MYAACIRCCMLHILFIYCFTHIYPHTLHQHNSHAFHHHITPTHSPPIHIPHHHSYHRYAWECQTSEGGWGLDGVLRDQAQYGKLRGIVNGIDYLEWNPEVDKFLQEDGYSNYTVESIKEGKAKCKAALQKVGGCVRGVWGVRV